MHTATARFGLLAMLVLLAAPAWAQSYEITFQVDMNDAITNCALDPESDQIVAVRGEHNGFDESSVLSDDDGDGIYIGTFTVLEEQLDDDENGVDGLLDYKFWGTDPVGWEDGSNRTLDPTGDETLPVVEFNKTFDDLCSSETETYEILFQVDMSVQISIFNQNPDAGFNPETDVVTAAGNFNGWDSSADTLTALSSDPNIYVGLVEADLTVPSIQPYKYIIGEPGDTAPDGWEGGGDRLYEITGDEGDANNNGIPEVIVPVRFFDDVTPDDVLTESATVVFEVDLRPAYYFVEDNGQMPPDTQNGEVAPTVGNLFVNGPFAGSADGFTDWAGWGDELAGLTTRQLVDDGTNGDAMAEDSIFTLTFEYNAGSPKVRVGKLGVNALDNEGGVGADHVFTLTEGEQTIRKVFGAVLQSDGTFTDDNGPTFNDQDFSQAYDPYILIDNSATPPTVVVVRSGGESDNPVAIEPTGVVPVTAELRPNYPNPFASATTFEYAIAEAGHVSLTVYDLMGRRVATLVDGTQAADTYRVSFDASELASGVYVVRLMVGDTVQSQKLTVTN